MIYTKLIKLSLCLILLMGKSFAWGDGGAGWAQYPYIVKILYENIKRYQQLNYMINQTKSGQDYLKLLHEGIDNAVGVMEVLPIKDEKVIRKFKDFKKAISEIKNIYGMIPNVDDAKMLQLHDQTIAESLKLASTLLEYSKKQEENAVKIHHQSSHASPKGAARINAQASAQILHSLNQLIKVNGQILKLQSENFAMKNKEGKESSESFLKSKDDLKKSMGEFKHYRNLPKF